MDINPKLLNMMSETVYKIQTANDNGKIPKDLTVGQLKKILGFLPERMPVLAGGLDELNIYNPDAGPPEVYQAQCFMMIETFNDQGGIEHGLVLLGRKVRLRK